MDREERGAAVNEPPTLKDETLIVVATTQKLSRLSFRLDQEEGEEGNEDEASEEEDKPAAPGNRWDWSGDLMKILKNISGSVVILLVIRMLRSNRCGWQIPQAG